MLSLSQLRSPDKVSLCYLISYMKVVYISLSKEIKGENVIIGSVIASAGHQLTVTVK